MDNQIIYFINPASFAGMLGNRTVNTIGFRQNSSFLNNGKHLIYVAANGGTEIDGFNHTKATNAAAIIADDNYDLAASFVPGIPFKVVVHSRTPAERTHLFCNSEMFYGIEKSIEEATRNNVLTPYKKIVDLINRNNPFTVKQIFDSIEAYSPVLEAKLKLLHDCFAFTTAPALDELLKEKHQSHYDAFIAADKGDRTDGTTEKHMDALTKFRIALLGE